MTTATTTVERTGPAIRAVLAEHSAEECTAFEDEFRAALEQAGQTLDLSTAEAVLDRWWGVATIRANPLSDKEQAQVARARDGDVSGLMRRNDQGAWEQL